jgi:hypothetical protein
VLDADEGYKLLAFSDNSAEDRSLDTGNSIKNSLKVVSKMKHLTGMNAPPAVVLDGVVRDVSYNWTGSQWEDWLIQNIV